MTSRKAARLATFVVGAREEAERAVAREIAELVRAKPDAVLGLATGDTPIGVYRELVRLHREEGLSFERVSTFNLDEYLGVDRVHAGSLRRWMRVQFFDHVDIARENVHELDGCVGIERVADECVRYEEAIAAGGGIDLQLVGIGRNGHIGFNEPGSTRASRTRLVELHAQTREDAAQTFGGLEHVPEHALTIGVATILEARRIRVLAFGAHKASIVKRTLNDQVCEETPSTLLREHGDMQLWLDRSAAGGI